MIRFEINYNNVTTEIATPIGWDSLAFQLVRDEVYHGIDLNVSTELTFIDNGFQILDAIITNREFDADVILNLWYKNDLIRKFRLNLFDYKKQSKQISVGITEISFFESIKSREGLEVDVYEPNNIDGNPLSVVSKLGMPFEFTAIPIVAESILNLTQNSQYIQDFTSITGIFGLGLMPQMEIELGEIQNTLVGGDTARFNNAAMYSPALGLKLFELFHIDRNSQNPPLPASMVVDYSIEGEVGYSFTNADTFTATGITISLFHGINSETEEILFQDNTLASIGGTSVVYSASGTLNLTIPAKGNIRIVIVLSGLRSTGGSPGTMTLFTNDNDWSFEFFETTILPSTFQKVTPIYEFTNRVLESITGKNNVLRSDYYGRTNSEPQAYLNNGFGSFKVITNGSNIRGFDEMVNKESEDYRPPIIKWSELFDSLNAIDNIGADVNEDNVRIEPKEYFYKNQLIKNLGAIKDVEFYLKKDKYYNEVQVGYEDWEDTIDKGLSEFASTRNYTNRIKRNASLYTIISALTASPFAIESTRRDSKIYKPTSRSKWDKNNFVVEAFKFLDINGQPTLDAPNTELILFAPAGTQITSVQNAASGGFLYNIELSPTRNLLKHQNVLQGDLFFVSGEGNFKMKSTVENQFGGNELDEQQNLTATPTLYYPIIAKFEYPVNIDEFMQWNVDKYGYFEFTNCGVIYKGFIEDVGYNSETNLCTFELILKA